MSHAVPRAVVAWALMGGIGARLPPVVRCVESELPALHLFLSGKARMIVKDSIEGAARRLAKPTCQGIFDQFTDVAGHPLADKLAEWGKTPADAMASLYFVEGDSSAQCRTDETTAAFTVPHSRVVHVCGTRFADRFARKTAGGEVLMIHELLHALGLGENPPTSAQVTAAVWSRCSR